MVTVQTPLVGLGVITPASGVTTATAPAVGKVNIYNTTTAGVSVSATLPALSGLNIGARLIVGKYIGDVSSNTVTINCASGDYFSDGATTSLSISMAGAQRELFVISIIGTKRWSYAGSLHTATTTLVSIDGTQTITNKTLTSPVISSPALSGTSKIATTGSVEIYNTSDQSTNFEKATLNYTSNTIVLGSSAGGTGTVRPIFIGQNSGGTISNGLTVDTASATKKFGLTIDSGVAGINIFNVSGQLLASGSATQVSTSITPTINQSGTGSYTALLINPTQTATGSGTKRLIDAQVGGSSRFTVDNAGTVSISGTTATARAGTGSPESSVTASVGSMYLRIDGGAGTTLYIKESGTGNTGWVAK